MPKAKQTVPKAQPSQKPIIGRVPEHHVRTQDCVQGMASLSAESVDVVVTSPPYNIRTNYNTYMDNVEQAEYLDWCITWTRAVRKTLKEKGSFFLNLGSSPTNPTIPHMLLYRIIQDGKFKLQNSIHWIKSITVLTDSGEEFSKGHFKPINSDRFLNDCHEHVFHLTPTGSTPLHRLAVGVKYKHKSNVDRWEHTNGDDLRCRGNTWFIPYRTIHDREGDRPHPATFPPELPEQCIRLHGVRDDLVVMDPFLGIGNTWVAAVKCGVGKFIGFDIDKDYLAIARKRASDTQAQRA